MPAVLFLDRRAASQLDVGLPALPSRSHLLLEGFVGDAASVVNAYSEAIHWHLPIISISSLQDEVSLTGGDVGTLLVLVAMKLLMWKPSDGPRPSRTYVETRQVLNDLENSGSLSFRLLQARILLLVFEYGHAIFPAAILSVAVCSRIGNILGIDQALIPGTSLASGLDPEQARRAWWTILLLDRVMQFGNPAQAPCTKDPLPSDLLPGSDSLFDAGVEPRSEHLYQASSPATIKMSFFVRVCQATYLLACVLRYRREGSDDEEHRAQLDRTLRSLLNLMYQEGSMDRSQVCVQTSIVYGLVETHQKVHPVGLPAI